MMKKYVKKLITNNLLHKWHDNENYNNEDHPTVADGSRPDNDQLDSPDVV